MFVHKPFDLQGYRYDIHSLRSAHESSYIIHYCSMRRLACFLRQFFKTSGVLLASVCSTRIKVCDLFRIFLMQLGFLVTVSEFRTQFCDLEGYQNALDLQAVVLQKISLLKMVDQMAIQFMSLSIQRVCCLQARLAVPSLKSY